MLLTTDDLIELVRQGEGRRLEFKRGLPRGDRVARTLCAFSNTNGGILLVGVTDSGRILVDGGDQRYAIVASPQGIPSFRAAVVDAA